MSYRPKEATPVTASINKAGESFYPLHDRHDFHDARLNLVAPVPDGKVLNDDGVVVFDLGDFAYLTDDAPRPDTVDASLWRTSQVIHEGGLYKVVDRIYQVRNNDIANLTIVEGDDVVIVIDCSTSVEAAAQGMALFREHVADKPVAAVIYTHTHVDHYGGVKGVVDAADVASGKVAIIAPGTIASFDKFAIGENVIAGNAMSRRAQYAFGNLLDREPHQFVTLGAGIGNGKHGMTISYISPTDPITETGQTRTIAGLTFEFLYAPDTEAPEEMHIWIPELKSPHLRRERQPLPPQHPDAAGSLHTRCPQLRPLPRRDSRAVGRPGRGALRAPLLAGVGQREYRAVPRHRPDVDRVG
ncbi:MBL fold metallo-hydrolase [Microbacterium phyllosphaerae]|uniref:MBL fold metallo-hydrolase n=1 Tax=Microbacterium phyllosphaerae TaxID=124798 RepID=UPI003D656372